MLVRFAEDNRYSDQGLASHDRIIVKEAVPASDLSEIEQKAEHANHVFIDEGQFFKGLKNWALKWAREGKDVTISALDAYGNHPDHAPWPEIQALEPFCAEVIKLNAVCFKCGDTAPLTMSTDRSNEPTQKVGGAESYIALCISCCFLKD